MRSCAVALSASIASNRSESFAGATADFGAPSASQRPAALSENVQRRLFVAASRPWAAIIDAAATANANTSTIRDVTRMTAILGRTGLWAACALVCATSIASAQIAQGLARADARHNAVRTAAARLGGVPAVRALGLTPGELEAFTAGLLDVSALATQVRGLHKDQDASAALMTSCAATGRVS